MTPFEFHTGLVPKEKTTGKGEKIYESDCPFCGKAGHFHFFADGRYGCKVCLQKGNTYTLIKHIVDKCTIADNTNEVGAARGVTKKHVDVRWNKLNSTWVLPTYKEGEISNLYKCTSDWKLLGTPGLPPALYNWEESVEKEVWITEGQWDKMALKSLMPPEHQCTVTAIPGAGMFRESWCPMFREKDIIIVGDNDDAGNKMVEKVIATFEESPQKPNSIRRITWPDSLKPGYDIRDYFIEHGRAGWAKFQKMIQEVTASSKAIKLTVPTIEEDFSCDSYDKALDSFETAFHTTPDMRATLAMTLASIYSVKIGGEQLWLKIIGPPGCGKTRIAKAAAASDRVVALSKFTGLFSGHSDDDESDAGLIPLISGRTLIVKDADSLVKQEGTETIMAELRDFYDKDSSVKYRNRRHYNYRDVQSTIIICGTQVLRRADQSFLGERFLTMEMDVLPADNEAMCRKAMSRTRDIIHGKKVDPEKAIASSMKGWINHLCARELDTTIPEECENQIYRLAVLASLMRTSIDKDRYGNILSPPVPEIPTRLIGQAQKAAYCLGPVFGQNIVTEEIFQIVAKSLKDTMNPRSNRFKIIDIVSENPNCDARTIEAITGWSKTVINDELNDLVTLQLLHRKKIPSTLPGARAYGFTLDSRVEHPLRDLR